MAKKKGLLSTLYRPSDELAEIVGDKDMPRTEVVKKLWAYIKKHDCQDGRTIIPDDKLSAIYGSRKLSMLKLMGPLSAHLEKVE